ncbi:hypothetical protein G8A07_06575 [Roseateles sp. DAIF2]|uniref:hypothetical protein n=1 Tax=Roseateles sp. DAIF2 TaxID=2714952 RepID=UPI0018A2A7A8|nr:hypothetical protein [Roseateles sp. DAIF2]QPF72627.1 hypothetical protein G8A07_06575 [Roseateles sp. DAIF2]
MRLPPFLRLLAAGAALTASLQAQASVFTITGLIDSASSPFSWVQPERAIGQRLSGRFELDTSRIELSEARQLIAISDYRFSLLGYTIDTDPDRELMAVYHFGELVGLDGSVGGYPGFRVEDGATDIAGARFHFADEVLRASGSYRVEAANPVSEPASLALGLGALGALALSRRRWA